MSRRRLHSINHQDKVEFKSSLGGNQKYTTVKSKKKKYKKYCFLAIIIFLGIVVFYFGSIGISLISAANDVLPSNISFKDIVSKSNLKQEDGVTNILLLGRDQAAQLTDTIQVIRVRQDDKKVAMVSIPRDLQVKSSTGGVQKINSVFGQGFSKEKDTNKKVEAGAKLAADTVKDVTGVPIHYYITVDFAGLKDIVDALDGVSVDVETSFTDSEYPKDYFTKDGKYVKTDGYETFSVKAGTQKMDGITALRYSRSRHGNNGEGSDFARAARQQKVIMAIKDKALSVGFLANPVKITNLMDSLGGHIKTNMGLSEIKELANYIKDVKKEGMISKVLSNSSEEGLLVSVDEGGYYLKPKAGNFSKVQEFVKNIFNEANSEANVTIEVYNGSGVGGQGTKFAEILEGLDLEVSKIDTNSEEIEKTVIYDGTSGSSAFGKIKKQLNTPKTETTSQANLIKVIIGKDYGK